MALNAAVVVALGILSCYRGRAQYAPLVPTSDERYQLLGRALALQGDRVAVGGAPDDDGRPFAAGAVYVFEKQEGTWSETARLTASDPAEYAVFGRAIALDGDRLLIGAPGYYAPRVIQNPPPWSGAAYIFEREGASWRQVARLHAEEHVGYGAAVALAGDLAVVGCPACGDSGTVYVYERDGESWQATAELVPADAREEDSFGIAVALQGDRLFLGAPYADSGNPLPGAVYVFERREAGWAEAYKLTLTEPEETMLGEALDSSEDWVVATTGYSFETGDRRNVFLFHSHGNPPHQVAELDPTGGPYAWSPPMDVVAAAVDADVAVVGTGDYAARVFQYDGATWEEVGVLVNPRTDLPSGHACHVELEGDRAVVTFCTGNNDWKVYVFDGLIRRNVAVEPGEVAAPAVFRSIFPNPLSRRAVITFYLRQASTVRIDVMDTLGRRRAVLLDRFMPAGEHNLVFEPDALPPGMYICRLQTAWATEARGILLTN